MRRPLDTQCPHALGPFELLARFRPRELPCAARDGVAWDKRYRYARDGIERFGLRITAHVSSNIPANDIPKARLTPYELVFMEGEFESRVFPRIWQEATENGIEPVESERFEFLSTAAEAVRDLVPEDSPPDALEQYRALLFHAFHFCHFLLMFLLGCLVSQNEVMWDLAVVSDSERDHLTG